MSRLQRGASLRPDGVVDAVQEEEKGCGRAPFLGAQVVRSRKYLLTPTFFSLCCCCLTEIFFLGHRSTVPSASKTGNRPRLRPRASAFDIRRGRATRRPTTYYVPWTDAEQRWLPRRNGWAYSFEERGRRGVGKNHVLASCRCAISCAESMETGFQVKSCCS